MTPAAQEAKAGRLQSPASHPGKQTTTGEVCPKLKKEKEKKEDTPPHTHRRLAQRQPGTGWGEVWAGPGTGWGEVWAGPGTG